ncbi:hypothetical protein OTB20_39530 [Streptomyces sp. H27-H1]|uniref:hypothetical protein n=1 Tax=Streptomyces sp. H27-H1 TaxID=2996461 RepID=UPI00226DE255|nr:hypothetical protein [Streptomyces sp. H27-H1]MCY0932154.1 hypothetical protein [Streptomyces sp. H27-H1]
MHRPATLTTPAHARTPDTSPAQVLQLTSPGEVARDVEIALALAEACPAGAAARAVRDRLRTRIRALADPAEAFAHTMADSRPRDIALATVRYARDLAADPGGDPVASLRLLAKSAQHLIRYAADGRAEAARPVSGLALRAAA